MPGIGATSKKKRVLTLEARKGRLGWIFIAPFLFGIVFLFGIPIIRSIVYSFGTVQPDGGAVTFAGLKNYYDALFVETEYRQRVVQSILNMLVNLPLITLYSFFIANVLNQKFACRGLFRVIFFLPIVLSSAAMMSFDAGDILQNTMGGAGGGLKESDSLGGGAGLLTLLYNTGLPETMIDYVFDVVGRINEIVMLSGVQTVIFLAALQSIPRSVYEAASIEGATAWESFWKVTFPMITPMIITCIVYTIIDSFNAAGNSTLEMMRDKAFGTTQNFGLGAAMAWIYSVVILLIIGIVFGLVARRNRLQD